MAGGNSGSIFIKNGITNFDVKNGSDVAFIRGASQSIKGIGSGAGANENASSAINYID